MTLSSCFVLMSFTGGRRANQRPARIPPHTENRRKHSPRPCSPAPALFETAVRLTTSGRFVSALMSVSGIPHSPKPASVGVRHAKRDAGARICGENARRTAGKDDVTRLDVLDRLVDRVPHLCFPRSRRVDDGVVAHPRGDEQTAAAVRARDGDRARAECEHGGVCGAFREGYGEGKKTRNTRGTWARIWGTRGKSCGERAWGQGHVAVYKYADGAARPAAVRMGVRSSGAFPWA